MKVLHFNSSQFFPKYPLAFKRNSSAWMSHLSDGIVPHQALRDCLHHFKSKFGCFQYLVGQRRLFYSPKQLHLDSTYKLVTTFLVQFSYAPWSSQINWGPSSHLLNSCSTYHLKFRWHGMFSLDTSTTNIDHSKGFSRHGECYVGYRTRVTPLRVVVGLLMYNI